MTREKDLEATVNTVDFNHVRSNFLIFGLYVTKVVEREGTFSNEKTENVLFKFIYT